MKTRKRFALKAITMFLLVTFVGQIVHPTAAWALTGGPSQPEVTQFQQVSASDMVDLFSGDFGYNIPLFEVPGPNGGYPFNLSYQSAPSMDQEASWVGLGWNINPGSIVRNMRGLPDDFDGQTIKRELDMKPNITGGLGVNVNWEIFSADFAEGQSSGFTLGLGLKIYYNNYKGVGYTFQPGLSYNLTNNSSKIAVGLGFNFSMDSQDGGIGANLDMSVATNTNNKSIKTQGKFQAGVGYNTNSGINASYSLGIHKKNKEDKTIGNVGSALVSFAYPTATPSIGTEMSGGNFTFSATLGFDPSYTGANHLYVGFSGFVDVTEIANKNESLPTYGYLHYHKKTNDEALVDFNRDRDVVVKEKSTPNLHTPVLTYDYYTVNGQGTGGMFRPYRPEVGYIHEQSRMSGSGGGSLGFNIPIDNVSKIGINIGFNFSDSRSGRWNNDQNGISNDLTPSLIPETFGYFKKKQLGQTASELGYEGAYFKMNGSMSTVNTTNYAAIKEDNAVRFDINNNTNIVDRQLVNSVISSLSTPSNLSSDITLERRPREQQITPVTNDLLKSSAGYESMGEMNIKYYGSVSSYYPVTPTSSYYSDRISNDETGNSKLSHIGGFIVTNPDGNRYVYGLPAYNHVSKEHIYTAIPTNYGSCQTFKDLPISGGQVVYKYDGTAATDDYDITEQFKSITTTPSYTHSHLLTSILGTDYVDIDGTPGPSDNDYGYWVKFNYVKTSSAYQWRSPFYGANYQAGSEASYEDDKISFGYGKKDIWYLGTVETKTHIAVFQISPRLDGKGAATELNTSSSSFDNSTSGNQYKLDKIKLYAKSEYAANGSNAVPIQTIHFVYDYSLCPGVYNNNTMGSDYNKDVNGNNISITNDGGKLTLKEVYFTYKNDHSGEDHRYKFTYSNNKEYSMINNKYDRWGCYSWYTGSSQCNNADFPYTAQFPQHPFPTVTNSELTPSSFNFATASSADASTRFALETKSAASAWCLTKVELPSGGSINIEYESDDYAYVQQREAAQMFMITSLGFGNNPADPTASENNMLYDTGVTYGSLGNTYNSGNCNRRRKIFFKLEQPISTSTSVQNVYKTIYNDYIHPLKRGDKYQVYINARVNLLGNVWENIGSYYNLDINPSTILSTINATTSFPADEFNEPVDDACHVGELPFGVYQGTTGGYYTHGYVILENSQIDNFDTQYSGNFHPISVNTWYYMKENLPKLIYLTNNLDPADGNYEEMIRGGSLLSIFPQIAALFSGYPKYCYESHFASKIDLNRSWIKLASPDRIKYGGGCRVKKLYMQDDSQWAQDGKTDKVGQIYDYTMEETTFNEVTNQSVTKIISSGVAAYEPIHGGEENALRYAKFYSKNLPLKSSNQTFYEGPINEAYFPAPQVGYRKVTVKSLPTQDLIDTPTATDVAGIKATGVTVNEFYTAKDFPSVVYETDLYIDPYVEAIVPIPFIGTITDKQIMASQGYVIRLNDMHGKPKSVASYGVTTAGVVGTIPTSRVEYKYKCKPIVYDDRNAFELDNSVQILADDPNMRGAYKTGESAGNPGSDGYEADIQTATMGLDYEFFYDMRQGSTKAGQGGLDFNLDVMGFGIFKCPIPLPWPSYSQSYAKINTVVANKIIQRTGILDKVIATDGQSTVSTQNLVFDPYTGTPLLTVVNNNYNEPVYNYSLPGRYLYNGMDAAYKNTGFEFSAVAGTTGITSTANTITINANCTLKNPLTAANITIADMVPYLNEGDEFIIEPQSGGEYDTRGYLLTTISNTTNCHTSGALVDELKFYIVGSSTMPATNGTTYKFTLVRSGKRNLLSNNVGSMVSLNTKDDAFLVNPNDPNPPTVSDIINRSPLKNRETESLSSSTPAYTNYLSSLASWLNGLLQSGVLPLGIYSNSTLASYPILSDKIEYIVIGNSTTETGSCLTCPPAYEGVSGGYSMIIKIKDEFGGDCLFEPCFARKLYYDGVSAYYFPLLTGFSTYVDNACTLTAHYDRGSGWSSPFTTCVDCGIPGSITYTSACFDCPTLEINPSVFKIKNILQASSYTPADIWNTLGVDMYANGNKGIWRPSVNYYYKDERYQDATSSVAIDLSGDGVFAGKQNGTNKDKMFYLFNWWSSAGHPIPSKWLLNNTITKYNGNGVAVETKDILDIYNATIFDANDNLPVAIADNATRKEMFAYNFDNKVMGAETLATDAAFTGIKSLKLTAGSDYIKTIPFSNDFSLTIGKTYHLSAWAGGFNMSKSPKKLDAENPNQMNIKVEFLNASNSVVGSATTIRNSGFIYEGYNNSYWRRIDGKFIVPTGATQMRLTFTKRDPGGTGTNQYQSLYGNPDNTAYFDDLRIHPEMSIMKTFVYDNVDFKLKAELDENNYPMYYGYDGSGQLTVVKVLTEGGIKTIKEAYSNTKN